MTILRGVRRATYTAMALLLLNGCAGSSTATTPLTAAPLLKRGETPAGRSWMEAGAAKWDLLYVANAGQGVVNVYRYWQRNLVGILTDTADPRGACADAAGDVYVVDNHSGKVFEYSHGGKKAIQVLDDSPYQPAGCAVDPQSGNLAIAKL